jgi:hypothetical protein
MAGARTSRAGQLRDRRPSVSGGWRSRRALPAGTSTDTSVLAVAAVLDADGRGEPVDVRAREHEAR